MGRDGPVAGKLAFFLNFRSSGGGRYGVEHLSPRTQWNDFQCSNLLPSTYCLGHRGLCWRFGLAGGVAL